MSTPIPLLLEQAAELLGREAWGDAAALYNQALALDPKCGPAFLVRGTARAAQRQWSEAWDDFNMAERLGVTNSTGLYRLRARANYLGNYDPEDRLDDAESLIKLAPNDADGWFYRGDSLSDLGCYEEAIESLDRAIALRPNHGDTYFERGMAWWSLDETEKATADLKISTELGSKDAGIYYRKGSYFQTVDDYEQAAKEFLQAVALDPENDHYYSFCGDVLQTLEAEGLMSGDEVEEFFLKQERLTHGSDDFMSPDRHYIYNTVQEHFGRVPLEELELTERTFPMRAMPDIQCAFDALSQNGFDVLETWATTQYGTDPVQQFSAIYTRDRGSPVRASNPKYQEYDIGEDEPFRCLKDGVWLLRSGDCGLLALLDTRSVCGMARIEVAAARTPAGLAAIERLFAAVEESVKRSRCYRGKVLSMEIKESYTGVAKGLVVHRLGVIDRTALVLPQDTLDLLDRNVINFARRRGQLAKLGMAIKKGLLFYGPPGVGKTHTVHYLATNLPDHTTLLITGDQVGNLSEYMTLARLYQPSIVVVEDVDLIARQREHMHSPIEEVMLNKLLNEMDGIDSDAAIIFLLTTNRVDVLEEALASRPGRIDQAIEFPLPTAEGRAKLVQLYSRGVKLAEEVVKSIVSQTDMVSASFIKELMRRCVQFALDRDEQAESIELSDVDAALREMLVTGGSLNKKLLGALRRGEPREVGFVRG